MDATLLTTEWSPLTTSASVRRPSGRGTVSGSATRKSTTAPSPTLRRASGTRPAGATLTSCSEVTRPASVSARGRIRNVRRCRCSNRAGDPSSGFTGTEGSTEAEGSTETEEEPVGERPNLPPARSFRAEEEANAAGERGRSAITGLQLAPRAHLHRNRRHARVGVTRGIRALADLWRHAAGRGGERTNAGGRIATRPERADLRIPAT